MRPNQTKFFKNLLIALLVIVAIPLLYYGLMLLFKIVVICAAIAVGYYVIYPFLKEFFTKRK